MVAGPGSGGGGGGGGSGSGGTGFQPSTSAGSSGPDAPPGSGGGGGGGGGTSSSSSGYTGSSSSGGTGGSGGGAGGSGGGAIKSIKGALKSGVKADVVSRLLQRSKLAHFQQTFGGTHFYTIDSTIRYDGPSVFKPLVRRNLRDADECFSELEDELFGDAIGGGAIDPDVLGALLSELGCSGELDFDSEDGEFSTTDAPHKDWCTNIPRSM